MVLLIKEMQKWSLWEPFFKEIIDSEGDIKETDFFHLVDRLKEDEIEKSDDYRTLLLSRIALKACVKLRTLKGFDDAIMKCVAVNSENEKLKEEIKEMNKKYVNLSNKFEEHFKKKRGSDDGSSATDEASKDREQDKKVYTGMGRARMLTNDLQSFSISSDEFPPLTQNVNSEKIATFAEIKRVQEVLEMNDVKEFSRAAFEFVITCGSKSTSQKSEFAGSFTLGDKTYSRSDWAMAIMASGVTVRRFCAAYANLYWNYNLRRNIPPENWRDKGFTHETSFSAFDFFYAVGSNSAIPTEKDGTTKLIREPSKEENEAADAVKWVKIAKAKSQSMGHVTSSVFLNRGTTYSAPKSGQLSITEL